MAMKIVVAIIIAIVVFEVIEHVVVPLISLIVTRKRRSVSGATGLLGKVVEVKRWKETEGYVFVRGELWKAVSKDPLSVGDKAVVQSVEGLTLKVIPLVNA
jgi:membrane-bound ClpP family serine protease